jgi:hypothetical protein
METGIESPGNMTMEMYVTDRCRFFDARTESWIRGTITDITIAPLAGDRTEPFITVETFEFGEHVLLGSDWHLNHIDFRITFSDFLRAAV